MNQNLQTQINELITSDDGPCVSLYMPTMTSGREVQQNHIRFKNLLHQARTRAEEMDGTGCLNQYLKKLESLVDDDDFWQHQSNGLAVFINCGGVRMMSLPHEFDERLHVGEQFQIVPLLPLLQQTSMYYVLAVSQNECKLYQGTQDSISEVPAEFPESLKDVVGSEVGRGFGLHSFRVRPQSGDSAVPHGHFESKEEAELEQYLRAIDDALGEAVKDPNAILVFAGVEEHFPIFKEISEHKGLQEVCLAGNPEHLSHDEIRKKAWQIVQPLSEQKTSEVLASFSAAISSDQFSDDPAEIANGAKEGRIGTLVVSLHRESNDPMDTDNAMEQIATAVMQAGGQVHVVEQDQLSDSRMAAIMRYPVTV